MPDNMMDALEPFYLERKKPFDMGYLSGFLAEKYTYLPKELYERMTKRIAPGVEYKAAEGRPYQRVYGVKCRTDFSSERQMYMRRVHPHRQRRHHRLRHQRPQWSGDLDRLARR